MPYATSIVYVVMYTVGSHRVDEELERLGGVAEGAQHGRLQLFGQDHRLGERDPHAASSSGRHRVPVRDEILDSHRVVREPLLVGPAGERGS